MANKEYRTEVQKYRNGNKQFPIIWEDGDVRIYLNLTDSDRSLLHIEDIDSGVTIKLKACSRPRGLVFTTSDRVEAISVGCHEVGWRIRRMT